MGTFELFTGSPAELPAGDAVVVQAWSGNVHPYRATAYRNGRVVGRTGFCATEARAVARLAVRFREAAGGRVVEVVWCRVERQDGSHE